MSADKRSPRTPGTPGFIPARLREARLARGIATQLTLAGLIGKTSSAVSRWEDGSASPTPELLSLLSSVLNVRKSFFLRPQLDHGRTPAFFRSLASAKVRQLERQKTRLRWLQEISSVIQHYVEFPSVDIPNVLGQTSYKSLREEDIERISLELRAHWNLGSEPITNVVSILESAGIVVGCDEMGTTNLDGLCSWSKFDDRPYILLAQDKMSFPRRQMDAAHEMAHAILHKDVTEEQLRQDFDLIETQAFRLASAFLMPHSRFPLEVRTPSLGGFLALKPRWRVSVKAMIKRCQDLLIIDQEEARQLYKHHSAKGWTRGEPHDQDFAMDPPRLLGDSIRMLVEAGERSKEDLLANEFIVSSRDIEQLAGLEEGWFQARSGEIVTLKPRDGRSVRWQGASGQIVQFSADRRSLKE